jgi:type II secretory pathway pseudopilin PulG
MNSKSGLNAGVVVLIVTILFSSCGINEANRASERAKKAKETIAAISAEFKAYHAENGQWPSDYSVLKGLEPNPLTEEGWDFTIIIDSTGLQAIQASSTDLMPGGSGKMIHYDVTRDKWSGYGCDKY